MNFKMLVEACHLPIPDTITVVQNFGETNVHGSVGDLMLLSGDFESFHQWLAPFGEVWIDNVQDW